MQLIGSVTLILIPPELRCYASKTSFTKANETDESIHFRRLANVLESFQLDMVNIAPDGDFLFSSVATHIEHLLSPTASTSDLVKAHLESIGIHSTMSRCSLIQHLRDLLVHEWLNNGSRYEPFFSGRVKNFEDEALQYQSPGMFSSELGDAMLLGLSNILWLSIVAFTSIESWPYIPVHPHMVPVDSAPIFLAFLQSGPGHYSLAIQSPNHNPSTDISANIQKSPLKSACRCGRGCNAHDSKHLNCSNKSDYSSRCPCLKGTWFVLKHATAANVTILLESMK